MDLMSHSSTFLLPTIPADNGPALTCALVVLNQRLPRFTPLLWQHAQLRICADGGANRLHDELPLLFPQEELLAVRNNRPCTGHKQQFPILYHSGSFVFLIHPCYECLISPSGTKILDASLDQDTSDLHKCIAHILDLPNLEKPNLCILVVGALGGRFDHEIGNINVLCCFSSTRIILLSDDFLIQLLPSTHHHEIHIQSSVEGPHCGLIPIGMPSRSTTTSGLQWDLTDTKMRFGGLTSTSNIVKGRTVTVRSESDLLWTISLRKT